MLFFDGNRFDRIGLQDDLFCTEMEKQGLTGKGPENINNHYQSTRFSSPFGQTFSYDIHLIRPS